MGQEPSIAAMGVTPEEIRQLAKDAQYPLSLDMPIRFGDDSVVGDFVEDQVSPVPDVVTTLSLLGQHLDQILEMLPSREAKILKMGFGLSNGETPTLQEIGL